MDCGRGGSTRPAPGPTAKGVNVTRRHQGSGLRTTVPDAVSSKQNPAAPAPSAQAHSAAQGQGACAVVVLLTWARASKVKV